MDAPARPWEGLPSEVRAVLRPELPALADDIIAAISEGVPEYALPLEGPFGRGLRIGVEEALGQFVEMAGSRDPLPGTGREIYIGLGRGEMRAGRPLGALLSAYRLGARVAWRRLAAAGVASGLRPETLYLLAESIFAYIDELSAASTEGYTEEQLAIAGEAARRRALLVRLIVRDPPADAAAVEAAAREAGWELPRTLAAAALDGDAGARTPGPLPPDALAAQVGDLLCVVVPDPDGPGRRSELERALADRGGVLGPAVAWPDAPTSFARAAATLALARAGRIALDGLVEADRHAADLLLHRDPRLAEDFARAQLAPLDGEPESSRDRLARTLLAWLGHQGRLKAVAAALDVHPQTVRYRLARARELLGGQLDDPDARWRLELALRIRLGGWG